MSVCVSEREKKKMALVVVLVPSIFRKIKLFLNLPHFYWGKRRVILQHPQIQTSFNYFRQPSFTVNLSNLIFSTFSIFILLLHVHCTVCLYLYVISRSFDLFQLIFINILNYFWNSLCWGTQGKNTS